MAIRKNKNSFTVPIKDLKTFVAMANALQGGTMPNVEAETTERSVKKKAPALSINNPYVVFSDELASTTTIEVKEAEGQEWLHFTNPNFKSGRQQGYAVADLRKAQEKFVADKYDEVCAKTGVRMAVVGDYKVSETLVKIAEVQNKL